MPGIAPSTLLHHTISQNVERDSPWEGLLEHTLATRVTNTRSVDEKPRGTVSFKKPGTQACFSWVLGALQAISNRNQGGWRKG